MSLLNKLDTYSFDRCITLKDFETVLSCCIICQVFHVTIIQMNLFCRCYRREVKAHHGMEGLRSRFYFFRSTYNLNHLSRNCKIFISDSVIFFNEIGILTLGCKHVRSRYNTYKNEMKCVESLQSN